MQQPGFAIVAKPAHASMRNMKKILAALTVATAIGVAHADSYAPQEFDFSELLGTVESVHQVPLEDRLPDIFQHALKPESVDQLTVRLDDGRALIVQQEELQRFARGQRVRLVGSANGVRIEHE